MYPWNVHKVHTNTQYLLGELGRHRLVRDSEKQGYTKGSKGDIKLNPPRTNPTSVLQCTVSQVYLIRICYDSTSKLNGTSICVCFFNQLTSPSSHS